MWLMHVYVGHSYGCKSKQECEAIAEEERQIMLRVKSSIENVCEIYSTHFDCEQK